MRLDERSLGGAVATSAAVPGYGRHTTQIGIVHIGPGAFHRAHQASYVDALLHTDPRWAICAISLKSSGVRDALTPQNGLYTLTELGEQRRVRVIGALREVLVGADQRDIAMARLTAPATRIVTLTVTEKGYCLNAHNTLDEAHPDIVQDWLNPATPRSVIGWLAHALRERRARGAAPFTIVSCDNLVDNGTTLQAALVAFAARVDGDLARWIEASVVCPRTMVDSITPATDDELRRSVLESTGVVDAWPVQREPFTQWVVQDVPAMHEADWSSVGVTLTKDVSSFERAKLRLLNGAHSTLAYVGLLLGHETVRDAMNDTVLSKFIERLMREDIAATLAASADLDVGSYVSAVLERFRNPGLRHLLSQIAWDGSKKLPVRILGTITDALQASRSMERLVTPIAAWMRFIVRQSRAGVPIVDPDADALATTGRSCTNEATRDVGAFAAMDNAIARALREQPMLSRAVQAAYEELSDPHTALRRRAGA